MPNKRTRLEPVAVRRKRVAKGYKASPKKFRGTRTEQIAQSGAARNKKKKSASAKNIEERIRQEKAAGIRRGGR